MGCEENQDIFLSIMESFVTRMYPFKTRELCDRDETCIDFSCSSQFYCLLLHLLSMVKKKHKLIFLNGEGFEFTWKRSGYAGLLSIVGKEIRGATEFSHCTNTPRILVRVFKFLIQN